MRARKDPGAILGLVLLLSAVPVHSAAGAEELSPAAEDRGAARFDPEEATRAYLARQSPEEKARSDAYFEGGYWLRLWGFLYGLGVAWLLLGTGLSRRMRELAERASRRPTLQSAAYSAQYIAAGFVLGFPLSVYAGFVREHRYDLSNQSFGAWLGDEVKGLAVGLVLGSLAIAGLYAVLRKAPRSWWIWGTVVALAFLCFAFLITPVFINPLFNTYTRLEDATVREPILSLARANGVPATDVWVFDASKQTKRVSANVAGFAGTERISLNDNLLARCTLPEIEAVMGHEMGHYVLNHMYELVLELGVVLALGFAFLSWGFERVRRRLGGAWGVRGLSDPAGLPLLAALLSVFFFFATPVTNSLIRVNEAEADLYGLNAAGQPDGFAEVALKLGEYRKLDPGPIEEFVFYDHPSGRQRIAMAMRWKAEHLGE